MRTILALALCALLGAAAVTGCAKKKTYSTPEGKVTVEEGAGGKTEITIEGEEGKVEMRGDEESMKITTDEGTVSIQADKAVSEKEIGLPLYPGAKAKQTTTLSEEGKQKGFVTVLLTTPDSVDEVRAFYKKRLPQAKDVMDVKTGDAHMVHMMLEEGDVKKMVQIARKKDATETQILLQKAQEAD